MVDINEKSNTKQRFRVVGEFIRKRRQEIKLSQKALGMLFEPTVTTQFISNVERGVTPLPPVHVPMLCRALKIKEEDLLQVLEKEYTQKLSGKLGLDPLTAGSMVQVQAEHQQFISSLYRAYQNADEALKKAFEGECARLLHVRKE